MLIDAAVAQRPERLDVDQEGELFDSLQLYQLFSVVPWQLSMPRPVV
jgi:hypothetical protein